MAQEKYWKENNGRRNIFFKMQGNRRVATFSRPWVWASVGNCEHFPSREVQTRMTLVFSEVFSN